MPTKGHFHQPRAPIRYKPPPRQSRYHGHGIRKTRNHVLDQDRTCYTSQSANGRQSADIEPHILDRLGEKSNQKGPRHREQSQRHQKQNMAANSVAQANGRLMSLRHSGFTIGTVAAR